MCGITGVLIFDKKADYLLNKIDNAIESLQKRGPDSNGVYRHNNVAIGNTRLSIIDTSTLATQPITDKSGRYTIVFNGEIFNYKELQKSLLDKGIELKSNSDTEVLLYLYITEGTAFLDKLNGFFAFAIYDKEEQSLFIARDRMGVKPLFIYQDEEKLIFGSEMKSLIAYGIPKEIDYVSLYNYFRLTYIPAPYSIFKNVRKVGAGTYLEIKGKEIKENRYYSIPESSVNESLSYDEAQKTLIQLLDKSVERRLISDVPLGAFLSGGIDSSVIVALASKHTEHLNTFSIGYKDEPFFDETKYAELVADKYKTKHTTFSLSNDTLFENLFDILNYIDEPFGDSSAIAVNILSKYTRKHVTVALSGDGADELFAGYNKHAAELKLRNPDFTLNLLKFASPLLSFLPKSRNSKFANKIRQIDKFKSGMELTPRERYWEWCSFVSESSVNEMLNEKPDYDEYNRRKDDVLKYIRKGSGINDVLYSDMLNVLQNDMLVKVDMMSMANSLEVRTPFLDYEVVNFAFSLPSDYKINSNMRKRILQDAFRNMLPEELYNRPKHGFEVPLLKWMKNELRSMIESDLLEDNYIKEQNIFNPVVINELKTRLFSTNPGDITAQIWTLIVFQYWWKKLMVNG